ncbi:MAG TPA: hypothetical protein VGJ91_12450 [Polyangiaceae bacterium]|jgi:hypothetical protein
MFLRSRRGWLLGIALFAGGCLSPTLPLPPPSDPMMTSTDTEGLVRLTGTVQPQSEVFALNRTTNLIRGQYTESGVYDFTIEAQERDSITFWYVRGTIESPPTDFVIKLTPP